MEHAYSHVLGELWGAVISTSIVFVGSLFFCWQLSIAAFWSVPVAFALLFATRKPMKPVFERNRMAKLKVTQGIQETLDCVREIRATNQGAALPGGAERHDRRAAERECAKGELVNGVLVNTAYAILRLGIATTLIAGASACIAAGQIDFMVMFAYLLVISRIYAHRSIRRLRWSANCSSRDVGSAHAFDHGGAHGLRHGRFRAGRS